jgi:Signal transduction histidine kinase
MISITVTDDGFGIHEKDLKHVFDKFYRGTNDNNLPGMGIGLSYVKMIIEAHHGKIKIDSELNKGTSITILIPHKI